MVLVIKYRQDKPKTRNNFSFLPLLSREDYSVFKTYKEADFEPFQSIFIPGNSSIIRYIVFSPSTDGFSPTAGELELQLFSRPANNSDWRKALGKVTFTINEEYANTWRDPKGQSLMTEAVGNDKLRDDLMEKVLH